ncbi:MAG: peptidase D-alanyl-D-alanine carboxypeptidase 1 [Chloroflexi bacterium]|nr:peptidase D-alanyl-D-alanine carboxypeptidase 1 [Chloroflexota bacterium]
MNTEIAAERDALEQAIAELAGTLPGRLGVNVRFLPGDLEVSFHADDLFPSASVIKIPIMVEAYRQAANGTLSLGELLPLLQEEVTDGSGLLQYMHVGLQLTVTDAVELMIAISDNTATNLLLRRLGVAAVNETMQQLGLTQTRSGGPIRVANGDTPLEQRSRTTPREITTLLAGIAQGTIVSADASAAMMRHLEHQLYNDMLPRFLPIIAYPERLGLEQMPVQVAHKTGGLSGVRLDAGIITAHTATGTRTAVVSAFTADLDDGEIWTVENVGCRTIAEVGRLVYDVLLRLPAEAVNA